MMTVEAAYALGQDSVVGSLRPGKLADLVVVSADPLAVPVDEIPDIAVMATLVGGTTRYCNREVAPVVCP
jgi:predicted amidohydrolase YtcJ